LDDTEELEVTDQDEWLREECGQVGDDENMMVDTGGTGARSLSPKIQNKLFCSLSSMLGLSSICPRPPCFVNWPQTHLSVLSYELISHRSLDNKIKEQFALSPMHSTRIERALGSFRSLVTGGMCYKVRAFSGFGT
jgi:hypothetical protein